MPPPQLGEDSTRFRQVLKVSAPRVFWTSHPRLQATLASLSLSYFFFTDSMVEPALPLTKVPAMERPYLVAILPYPGPYPW